MSCLSATGWFAAYMPECEVAMGGRWLLVSQSVACFQLEQAVLTVSCHSQGVWDRATVTEAQEV